MVLDACLRVKGGDVVNALASDDESVLGVVGVGGDGWGDGSVGDCSNSFVVGIFEAELAWHFWLCLHRWSLLGGRPPVGR